VSKLYLILHKVRGEPAWDVAEPATIGNEQAWIIPTSGHRAYPARQWSLDGLNYPNNPQGRKLDATPADVAHLPDHYAANDRVAPQRSTITLSVDSVFAALTEGDHD
jgi:hypothetical protein